jgi:LmbE family N-acetylglucosaminyl deacetylase
MPNSLRQKNMDMLAFQKKVCALANKGELILLGEGSSVSPGIMPPERGQVVELGPHPDDPDAVAVTLRLFATNGCRVSYVITCLSPQGVTDSYALQAARKSGVEIGNNLDAFKRELRRQEQITSARLAGFAGDFLQFHNLEEDEKGRLVDSPANARVYAELLASLDPDIVLMPYGEDTNSDHVLNWRFFYQGAWQLARKRGKPILGLYNRDPKTVRINEQLAVPFGREMAEWKSRLLRTHSSQHERNLEQRGYGFDERILEVNREAWKSVKNRVASGWPENYLYAETFQVECFY